MYATDYEKGINRLIPKAARKADKLSPIPSKKEVPSELARQEASAKWNKIFHKEMDRQAKIVGLRCQSYQVKGAQK